MGKGILEFINEDSSHVEYNSERRFTVDNMANLASFWDVSPKRKPEYLLSKQEAKELSEYVLEWLGENFIVLCSLETQTILKNRGISTTG